MVRPGWDGTLHRLRGALPLLLILFACSAVMAQNVEVQPAKQDAPAEEEGAAEGIRQEKRDTQVETRELEGVPVGDVIKWGGIVGYLIILLSIVTLTLVVYHVICLRKGALFPPNACVRIGSLVREAKLKAALDFVKNDKSLISRIIGAGLTRVRGGYGEMEQIMGDVADDEAMRLEQGVGYFSLIAAVAPLLGLLGTVMGMIVAFYRISKVGVVTPQELADPIQKALVTTCFGLIVAIPNVVAFSLFRNRLRRLMTELSVEVEELMMPLRGLKPIPASARPAAAPVDAAATDTEMPTEDLPEEEITSNEE